MAMSLNDTPRAMRLHIGLFGCRNSGKSSLINALTGQHVATVSDVPGTTTDPVYKSMEIHGIGPVVFIDTAGFDDSGSLGALRVERTRDAAKETDIAVDILPGMSFVEVMYTRLGIDPIEGLTILDAEDVSTLKERPAQSLVITQVYDPIIASDTKLMLMEFYPDEYEVTYIHNLALPDESIRKIPLYELDRQKDVDHLTSLFVPAQ